MLHKIIGLAFCAIVFSSVAIQAQPGMVTSAALAFDDNKYEDAINDARKALSKPDLLKPKQVVKAQAILAKSYAMVYNKALNKPEIKTKVDAAYPTLLEDLEKSIEAVATSTEAGDYSNDLKLPRQVLGIAYVNKAQGIIEKEPAKAVEYLNKTEAHFKAIGMDNPLPTFIKGVAKLNVGDNANKKSAMADFKTVIEAFKKAPVPKDISKDPAYKDLRSFAAQSYSRLISLTAEYDKANVNALVEEAKAKFPDDKEISDAILNVQVTTGSTDDAEKALAADIAKDPKNEQKRLVYASVLEKKYEALKKNNAPQDQLLPAMQKTITAYMDVLNLNPNREEALFNLGAILYNHAVEISKVMNALPDSEEKKYDELKAVKLALIEKAMPYMEKVAEIQKFSDRSTLSTLVAGYSELSKMDKQKLYQDKLNALGK